jgi:hypothetical protein
MRAGAILVGGGFLFGFGDSTITQLSTHIVVKRPVGAGAILVGGGFLLGFGDSTITQLSTHKASHVLLRPGLVARPRRLCDI